MRDTNFDSRFLRLQENVYAQDKGRIRLTLLEEDLLDFVPEFSTKRLKVLDAGGGAGHFSRLCAHRGHLTVLCDISGEMLALAARENDKAGLQKQITLLHLGLHEPDLNGHGPYDLVALHGVVEWMADPESAIHHACSLVRPGGILSLLVFNRDKLLLKQGINGMLHSAGHQKNKPHGHLTPPNGLSPRTTRELLDTHEGSLLLQSGIRIFNGFFREITPDLTPDQWLSQERLYSRQEPFSGLGEHSHFLWRRH